MQFFNSHASKDREYGDELVKLLRRIEVTKKGIVFTSNEVYGVPGGQNIFDWLNQRLRRKCLLYIFYQIIIMKA